MKIGKRKSFCKKQPSKSKFLKLATVSLVGLALGGLVPDVAFAEPGSPKSELSEWNGVPSYPPTPAGVDDTLVNVKDAFVFPGIEDVSAVGTPGVAIGSTEYQQANWAHLSADRSNVVMMNKWTRIGNTTAGYGLQKSMFWYGAKLDLTKNFEFEYYVFLSKAEAREIGDLWGLGDGVAFVMQNDKNGLLAPGGYGGGLGVYPDTVNGQMIYNSVVLEFDTYANVSDSSAPIIYDQELKEKGMILPSTDPADNNDAMVWPHAGIGVAKPDDATTQYGPKAVAEAYNNANKALHLPGTVSYPRTRTEQHAWFGRDAAWNLNVNNGLGTWLKVNVNWTPSDDKKTGALSYELAVPDFGLNYGVKSTVLDIDKTFNHVNIDEQGNEIDWDRKVYWGFTSSNYFSGNDFGVMFSKLPQQPVVETTRKVKNLTQDGENGEYKRNNHAAIDDVLEYQVTVTNGRTEDSELSLFNTNVVDELDNGSGLKNEYVPGSFTFKSDGAAVQGTSGANPVATINEDGDLTFEDSEHEYVQGESFTYTYQVKVTAPSIGFENDVHVRSRYSEEVNSTTGSDKFQGIVNVAVDAKDLTLTKTANKTERLRVGDVVNFKLEASVTDGLFVTDKIADTLPEGMEVVPNSTYQYRAGDTTKNQLKDSDVWTGGNKLAITYTGNDRLKLDALGTNTNIIVEYQVKVTEAGKGKDLTNEAIISGTNNYIAAYEADQKHPNSADDAVMIQVDTELEIDFQDMDGNLLPDNYIVSSDADFKGSKVIIYLPTDTAYDYTATIQEISDNLLANQQLTELTKTGDISSTGIPAAGAQIVVQYSAKSSLTVQFVNEAGTSLVDQPLVFDYDVKTPVDLTKLQEVLDTIAAIEARQYVLESSGRPENETNIIIQPNGTVVTYTFKGTLSLTSAPSKIDFGLHNTGSFGSYEASKPAYDNPLIVSDSRATTTKWTLTATVTELMHTEVDNQTYTLPNALVYKRDNTEEVLELNQARIIYLQETPQFGDYNVSQEEWDNKDNGFEMKLSATQFRQMSEYTATILFTVSETY